LKSTAPYLRYTPVCYSTQSYNSRKFVITPYWTVAAVRRHATAQGVKRARQRTAAAPCLRCMRQRARLPCALLARRAAAARRSLARVCEVLWCSAGIRDTSFLDVEDRLLLSLWIVQLC